MGRKPKPEPTETWRKRRSQVGALPFRFDDDGGLRVMLITSRETRRWVIPKGWPMRALKPHRAAEREAFEEAGLKGRIGKAEIGRYAYDKRLGNGLSVPVEVTVFPLRVVGQRKRWPEMDQRDGRWFAPEEAALLVEEQGLQRILADFEPPPNAGRDETGSDRPQRHDRKRRKQSALNGDDVQPSLKRSAKAVSDRRSA